MSKSIRVFLFVVLVLCRTILLAQNHAPDHTSSSGRQVIIDEINKTEQLSDTTIAIQTLHRIIAENGADAEIQIKAFIASGNVQLQAGHFQHALKQYQSALRFAAQAPPYFSLCHNKIGNAYNMLSDQDNAAWHYNRSARYSESIASSVIPASYAYSNLGTILSQQKQYDKALYYTEKGIVLARKSKDQKFLATLILNKGLNQNLKGENELALRTLDTAAQLCRKEHFDRKLFTVLLNMGNIHLELKQPEQALKTYTEARALLAAGNGIPSNEINSLYRQLSDIYFQQKQYTLSQHYLDAADAYATNSPIDKYLTHYQQARLAFEQGHYKNAYEEIEQFRKIKDSIESSEIVLKVQELETKYRTLEKDKEISDKSAQISTQSQQLFQKNLWITIFILSFLILAGVFTWWRLKRRTVARMEKKTQEIEKLQHILLGEETERKRLAQELHDGINSQLSGAKSYMLAIGNKFPELTEESYYNKVKEILDHTSKELRSMAHNLAPGELNKGLVQAVTQFTARVQTEQVHIEFQHYGYFNQLSELQSINLYRIIQELVHNGLKHAQASEIIVLINEYPNEYCIIVEDNGRGFIQKEDAATEGIGLNNIRDRVHLLQGSLTIESTAQSGTTFAIHVPKLMALPASVPKAAM
ncbi:tetratricopeptide repeat-containing sensor histidine kinase [Edaphocola aurantiacus]|uniref:tetratricopeptide repeat-containing sensor histidine kinase n=1 Tax=Edaphocola aurantiacus TaxID=2601682 RepID=UPI001C9562D9|nr:tetratricopeptide repeat protein [Edaphocola aurantiacus]